MAKQISIIPSSGLILFSGADQSNISFIIDGTNNKLTFSGSTGGNNLFAIGKSNTFNLLTSNIVNI